MEDLSGAVTAAKSAVLGNNGLVYQSGTEPLSGGLGKGTATEPYDAGNVETQSETEPLSGETGKGTALSRTMQGMLLHSLTDVLLSGQPGITSDAYYNTTAAQSDTMDAAGDASGNPNISNVVNNQQGGQVNPHHETDKTGVTDFHSTDAQSASGPPTSANASSVETRGQDRGPIGGVGAVEPSIGAQPDSGANVGSKQQGAEQPLDEPSGEQVNAIKGQKEKHEDAQQDDDQITEPPPRDPNDHSGEPLGTVDHGAAGHGQSQAKDNEQEGSSEEKGTGEKWVKSTGVAADGGDFDATKPGAGKEAERLLEQAGVHRTQPGLQEAGGDAADPLDPSNKPSIGEKIKGKLHIGHKD